MIPAVPWLYMNGFSSWISGAPSVNARALGIWTGLASSMGLILIGPTILGAGAIFPLANPGIVSIPLSFIVTFGVSMAQKK